MQRPGPSKEQAEHSLSWFLDSLKGLVNIASGTRNEATWFWVSPCASPAQQLRPAASQWLRGTHQDLKFLIFCRPPLEEADCVNEELHEGPAFRCKVRGSGSRPSRSFFFFFFVGWGGGGGGRGFCNLKLQAQTQARASCGFPTI